MQYLIIPNNQVDDKEKNGAIELPDIPENIEKLLLETLNDRTVSKTVYREKEYIKVSEGYGPNEIANWRVIFGNVAQELTFPNSTPNPDKRWNYKHYTLTPTDRKGVIAIETVSRISGPYTNKKIFIIPAAENNEANSIHE